MSPVEHLNPDGLPRNPAFTQAVAVSGPHRTLYIGGQNAVNEKEEIVGPGDIETQTRQIFANLRRALHACGAELAHVVKWTVHVVDGESVEPAFAVFQDEWGQDSPPPAITMCFVPALAHPDFLAEIEAVAIVPD